MGLKILVNSLFGGGAELQAALLARVLKPESFLILEEETSTARPGLPPYSALARSCPLFPGAAKTLLLLRGQFLEIFHAGGRLPHNVRTLLWCHGLQQTADSAKPFIIHTLVIDGLRPRRASVCHGGAAKPE